MAAYIVQFLDGSVRILTDREIDDIVAIEVDTIVEIPEPGMQIGGAS